MIPPRSAPWTRKAGDASASDPPAPGGAGGRAGAEGAGPKPPSTPNGITGDPARTPARATEAAYPDIATPGGARRAKFARVLSSDVVDLEALRDLAWSGIPSGAGAAAAWVGSAVASALALVVMLCLADAISACRAAAAVLAHSPGVRLAEPSPAALGAGTEAPRVSAPGHGLRGGHP